MAVFLFFIFCRKDWASEYLIFVHGIGHSYAAFAQIGQMVPFGFSSQVRFVSEWSERLKVKESQIRCQAGRKVTGPRRPLPNGGLLRPLRGLLREYGLKTEWMSCSTGGSKLAQIWHGILPNRYLR